MYSSKASGLLQHMYISTLGDCVKKSVNILVGNISSQVNPWIMYGSQNSQSYHSLVSRIFSMVVLMSSLKITLSAQYSNVRNRIQTQYSVYKYVLTLMGVICIRLHTGNESFVVNPYEAGNPTTVGLLTNVSASADFFFSITLSSLETDRCLHNPSTLCFTTMRLRTFQQKI